MYYKNKIHKTTKVMASLRILNIILKRFQSCFIHILANCASAKFEVKNKSFRALSRIFFFRNLTCLVWSALKYMQQMKKADNIFRTNKIYPSAILEHSFTISTLIPSLKKIGKGLPKIESENQFLTPIKGRNSVLTCHNLPICNPRTLLPNINTHGKFEENWLKSAPNREWKRCADRYSPIRLSKPILHAPVFCLDATKTLCSFRTKRCSNQSRQLQREARKLKFCLFQA